MKPIHPLRSGIALAPLAVAVGLALLAPKAQAFEFGSGEFTGSVDTTVSYGYSWRVEDQDPDLIGKARFNPLLCAQNQRVLPLPAPSAANPFPACAGGFPGSPAQIAAPGRFSINRDDGNLKYDKGDAIANTFKITSEMKLGWGEWGAFARATYFYDFENADREDLSEEARSRIGERFRMLDAFVFRDFSVGEQNGTVRLGRQVISWGESTFIQNGINVINPLDLSALRVAGAELKEAFLPVDSLYGSFNLTQNIAVEAFYLFEFEEIEVDAAGTYFSSNDFASPGGTYVMLGFGTVPQPVENPDRFFATCFRGPAGVLNTDLNIPGLPPGVSNATIASIGCGAAVARLPDRAARDDGQYGAALRWYAAGLGETEFGFYAMNYHSRLPLLSGRAVTGPSANTARFFVEYPEDIQLYGLSWNTNITGGIAFQGEVTYRPNAPFQLDDVELLFAGLTPLNSLIAAQGAPPAYQFRSQLGQAAFGQEIRGWREHAMTQVQMTFTKVFGQVLGADQIALVGEVGATDVDLNSSLRYEGEGTDTGGGCSIADVPVFIGTNAAAVFNPALAGCARNPQTLNGGFPTDFSWGYRLAVRADYNSFAGTPFTFSPRVAFNHDVQGITPGPGGNFLEGRRSLTLGGEFNYLNTWIFDIAWTSFSGGEPYNQIADRDFASASVRYSF